MLGLEALLVFASVVLVGYGALIGTRNSLDRKHTLTRRLQAMTGAGVVSTPAGLLRDERLSRIEFLNALLRHIALIQRIARMIRQAGLRRRVGEVLVYIPLLFCVGFLACALFGLGRFAGLVIGSVLSALPLMIVQRMRRKRAHRFSDQLPDALDLIRAALQAGHGFVSALGVVADEFPDPVAQEFRWMAEEIRLGLPMRDALYHLAERVNDENLPILAIGVLIAQDIGGNLAEVIDNISYTIRERFKLQREVRVLTAQGRLSGGVLTALPFGVGGLMLMFNPEYFRPMLTTPNGRYMLGYALSSILLGHLFIRRTIKIRV